ncbi:MAG: hypothetical protein IKW57_04595 [Alphaproteobacteria bacterium]|nr:hypothetical protein [Alphaproteobacteria bacterium]
MSWLKRNKWLVIICTLIVCMFGAYFGMRSRISHIANMVCLVQYDDMSSDMSTTAEIAILLQDGRDAFCDCYVSGLMPHWHRYAFMSIETMIPEMISDGAEPSYSCLDVFADIVYGAGGLGK